MCPATTTFDSTKVFLKEIMRSVATGKVQLPDFQRGWVWDDERIKSLLASVSLSFPIGAVMMLQTGNEDVKFKPRLVEGVEISPTIEPDNLILDGQQRLTALFQALIRNKPVDTEDTRKKPLKRWYYIDIEMALNPDADREDCIRGLPEDKIIRNFRGEVTEDYSAPKREYEAGLFPLCQVFDCDEWRDGYQEYWDYDKERIKQFNQFNREVIKRFENYQVPLILMNKETPKEAVCLVFEKVNTGGVSLTVFELLTATFAAENFNLRDDWGRIYSTLKKYSALAKIENTDFLQAITLAATQGRRLERAADGEDPEKLPAISCKRKDILKLTRDEYQQYAGQVTKGFERAAKFLFLQNIFTSEDIPYRTQIVPLAATLAVLGDEADTEGARKKLIQWYWCGVLGELYGSAVETRFAKDLGELVGWLQGKGSEPTTISDASFAPSRLLSLRTRNSAAYKGLYALLMRDGGIDFRTGEPIDFKTYFDDNIDIHHIFPQAWCKQQKIPQNSSTGINYNSIINKTPLSSRTNRTIGKNAPSTYLKQIERLAGIDEGRLDEILKSHLIEPKYLRSDDFEGFFNARMEAILQRIEGAMGKPILREEYEG